MSAGSEQQAELVKDLRRLHNAGGLGFWNYRTTPLVALAGLAAVERRAGSRQAEALTRAIGAMLVHATRRLKPPVEGEIARELLGITRAAAALRAPRDRAELAAKPAGRTPSTFGRRYVALTLEAVAVWLLDHDHDPDDAGAEADVDHESSVDELAGAVRTLPQIDDLALVPLTTVRLDDDLRRVLAGAYHSLRAIHHHQTFLSAGTALELRELAYDNDCDDWVYVLARRDHRTTPGFVQQRGWAKHVEWLRVHARHSIPPPQIDTPACGPPAAADDELGVRQIRVVIAADSSSARQAVDELIGLHRSGTLFWFPEAALRRFRRLRALRYGMTVSTSHDYAMVSVPPSGTPPVSAVGRPWELVEHYLDQGSSYDAARGDMRAVVTAASDYVQSLKEEFEALIASKHVHRIPCPCETDVT